MARTVFAARFTETTGVPPIHYLTRWRMQVAIVKTREGLDDLESIARMVGYTSTMSFQRTFKRTHGFTPTEARRQDLSARDISM